MPKSKSLITNFSSGEITPELGGRVELPVFKNSVSFMQNFVPTSKGAARYKYGGAWISLGQGYHIPYTFDDEFSYSILVRSSTMNFMKNGAIIFETTTPSITAVTKANPAVVSSTGHGFSDGDEIYITGAAGMEEILGGPYIVANKNANDYELTNAEGVNIDSTNYTTYTGGGVANTPVVVASPWTLDQATELRWTQIDAILYLVQKGVRPKEIARGGDDVTWTIQNYVPTGAPAPAFTGAGDFPRVIASYGQRLIFGSSINNPMKLWFSEAGDVNDLLANTGATDPFARIMASSVSEVMHNLHGLEDFLSIITNNQIYKGTASTGGEFTPSDFSVNPYSFIGSANFPSATSDNRILFIQNGRKKIRSIRTRVEQEIPVPDFLNLASTHLASSLMKATVFQEGDPNILYCLRDDGAINIMTIDDNEQIVGWARWKPTGGEVFSIGVTKNQSGYDEVWMCIKYTIEGGVRYYNEFFTEPPVIPIIQDFFTGGSDKAGDESSFGYSMYEAQKTQRYLDSSLFYDGAALGLALNVTLTPSAVSGSDVTMTASGAFFLATDVGKEIHVKGAVGRITIHTFTSTTAVKGRVTVTFANTNAIAAGSWYLTTITLSGLRHLEGETIKLIVDGGTQTDALVTNGQVTLNNQYSFVFAGFGYPGTIVTNELNQLGSLVGEIKSIYRMAIRFLNTLGARYGTDPYALKAIQFRSSKDLTNRPVPLFTGDKDLEVLDFSDLNKKIVIRQDSPLPCTVVAIKSAFEVGIR